MYLSDYESLEMVLGGLGVVIYIIAMVISLAVSVVTVIALWKLFVKAGEPGWASIIPVYNCCCLAQIGLGNKWLGLLSLIPGAGGIFMMVVWFLVAKNFGKGTGFSICTVLFTPICLMIMAFGSSEYVG